MDAIVEAEATFGVVTQLLFDIKMFVLLMTYAYRRMRQRVRRNHNHRSHYTIKGNITRQLYHMNYLVGFSDVKCKNNLRMNQDCFNRLCFLLQNVGGLSPTRNVTIAEQVAIMLTVLSHHTKNRVVQKMFFRSGYTISKHFNKVLNTLLKLHTLLLVTPEPVQADNTDFRWKYFKGCLGALDGTYIPVKVLAPDTPRYRNRKGEVSVNVLAVCDRIMNYTYILSGWEGSAADSRVFRDAITRPAGLRVPADAYYLCDGGYTNGKGFLSPYRGVRYHLKEWDVGHQPENHQEYFNLKHVKARNVIERSFGILKHIWGILRSNSYYPIKTHNRIILGCCLLHNFIRTNSDVDPMEDEVPVMFTEEGDDNVCGDEFIDQLEPSQAWTSWRDNLATQMFNAYDGLYVAFVL